MSRLEKEIGIYRRITEMLAENPLVSVEKMCAGLGITELTLFRFLSAGRIELSNILWKGVPLSSPEMEEYIRQQGKQQGRNVSKAARLANLVDLLNRTTPQGGLTIDELEEQMAVSRRTIYRDLEALEVDLGLYVERPERNAGEMGRYRLGNIYLPSLDPVKALFIYLSLMQQKGSALAISTREIKQALLATLAKNRYRIQDILLERLDECLANPEEVGKHLVTILDAVDKSYTIRIRYFVAYRQQVTEW